MFLTNEKNVQLLFLIPALVFGFTFAASAQEESPDPQVKEATAGVTMVDKLKDTGRQPYKVEPDTSSKDHVISVRDMLFARQVEHEKSLIDKFLLGVAILFSIIAMLLFVSLPPQEAKPN